MPGHTGGHEGKGFGSGFNGGNTGSTSGSTSGGATGPGGLSPGRGPGGQMMAGASPGDLSRATTEGFDTTRGFDEKGRAKGEFIERIKSEEDESNPIKLQDISRLYDELNKQNINPNQVSLENFTQGPFAQKNVVTHKGKRIGQFTSLPAFGLSGFLADIVGLDLRGLNLDQSIFGELDRGGRADERSIMEILYPSSPDAPEEDEDRGEGGAYIDDPSIFTPFYKDFYGQQLSTRGFQPMRNGGRVGYKEGKTVEKKFEDLTKDEKEEFVKEYEKFLKEQDKKIEEAAKREREERAASGFLRFKDRIERGMPPVDERTGFYGFANPDVLDVNLRKKIEDDIYLRGGVRFPQNGDPFYSAGITKTFNKGGLASLPINFNPMTNANPFSMMMRGGR
jgi:hypothetical protein